MMQVTMGQLDDICAPWDDRALAAIETLARDLRALESGGVILGETRPVNRPTIASSVESDSATAEVVSDSARAYMRRLAVLSHASHDRRGDGVRRNLHRSPGFTELRLISQDMGADLWANTELLAWLCERNRYARLLGGAPLATLLAEELTAQAS